MLAELRNPALVIVDMQNDFVRVGAPMEVPAARASIPAIRKLATAFRAGAKPVIFTRYVADPFYRPLAGKLGWIKLLDAPIHACVPGFLRSYGDKEGMLDAAEVIDELTPLPGETVVDKVYFSAFHGTDLNEGLNRLEIDALVFVGTVAEMCVEDSARHAVHHGYPTVLVEDAVSSNDLPSQRATLNGFARNYGWVMTADAVLETFGLRETAD
jgi:ureidoacrylate peracid hydrolase